MKKFFLNKKITIFLFSIILSLNLYSLNLYTEYNDALDYYNKKDYEKALFSLESILNEFPDYNEAKLLYFKTRYNVGNLSNLDRVFSELIETNDEIRKKLLDYLIEKKDEALVERTFLSFNLISEDSRNSFLNFLYENKSYNKIISKYPDKVYLDKIGEDKKQADSLYYKALEFLRQNKSETSILLMKNAINLYKENYIYYFKLGQIYADAKNFNLSEHYFLESLKYSDSTDIYLNLFNLYYELKNYDKMYTVSKYIYDIEEVRKKLKKVYYTQPVKERYIKIIKKSKHKIYIDSRSIPNLKVGDSFILNKEKEVIYDDKTGEKLALIKNKIARIRVSGFVDKLTIFNIIEESESLELDTIYILN